MSENWDFERQKSETIDTVSDLSVNQEVKTGADVRVTLDIFLVPTDAADQTLLERALAMFGYAGDFDEENPDSPSFVVSVPDVGLTAEDIWLHEERVCKIAMERGFLPDGWGFFEP